MAAATWGSDRSADQVDDFDDYDPTPYGGGYDLFLTFGRALPPSDETCHPMSNSSSSSSSYDHPHHGSGYGRTPQVEDSYGSGYGRKPHADEISGSAYGSRPHGGEEYVSGGYRRRPQDEAGDEAYGSAGGYAKPKPHREEGSYGYGEEKQRYQSGGYERTGNGGREDGERYQESCGRKKHDDDDSDDEKKSRYQKRDDDSDDEDKPRYKKDHRRRHDYDD